MGYIAGIRIMCDKEMAKQAMLEIVYNRLRNGEIIKVEYGDVKRMNNVRKYFPKQLEKMFSTEEIAEIIACSMDIIHCKMSASGMGVVRFWDNYVECLIQYWMVGCV